MRVDITLYCGTDLVGIIEGEIDYIQKCRSTVNSVVNSFKVMRNKCLTTDKCKTVGRENLVDGLEVGDATAVAVARASRSNTLGLSAGVERAARVAGLSAHTGLGETSHTSFSVIDGCAEGADSAAEDASGGAGAADAGSSGRGGAA